MSTLRLTHVSKSYGAIPALRGVSLDVASGEFICLLGASGCGKTTLLRIIAGLEQHDQGEIQLNNSDLSAVPCHQRNIGMVFQSLALFPHLNVSENITYGLKMRGVLIEERQQHALRLLAMVGLEDFGQRKVKQLSGGQRQRVAIARALAQEPQLFLMDEPFSALDAGLRDHLQLEVRKLQQDLGITTVFVTHDQREAMALADRIVILNEGKVEQAATPAEIYRYPKTRFVAEFIGNNNLLDVDITSEAIRFGDIEIDMPEGEISGLSSEQTLAIRPELINLARASNDNIHHGLRGRVVLQRQVGALVEREIDVAGTIIRQTEFQNTAASMANGDEVVLSWDWSQVWVLPQ
jgi:putative spermidine/putrescine transport system ATP-binding protein